MYGKWKGLPKWNGFIKFITKTSSFVCKTYHVFNFHHPASNISIIYTPLKLAIEQLDSHDKKRAMRLLIDNETNGHRCCFKTWLWLIKNNFKTSWVSRTFIFFLGCIGYNIAGNGITVLAFIMLYISHWTVTMSESDIRQIKQLLAIHSYTKLKITHNSIGYLHLYQFNTRVKLINSCNS